MAKINSLTKYTTIFESGCKILYGPHAACGYLLTITAEISAEQPLHLLDFGNRCDMYFTARQLRFLTRDPAAAMQNIRLQRAFTCYQALALLRQINSFEPGLPVIILDLLAPFLDENIKTAEIFRLFQESVEKLHIAMKDRPLLIGVKPVPQKLAPDRVCLLNHLAHDFGLIALQNSVPSIETSQMAESGSSGYRLRPAAKAFGHRNGNANHGPQPALMDGQPTLFD